MYRRAGQFETVGDLADAETARSARQNLQDARGPINGLDRPTARGPFCAVRHCRITFGSVDLATSLEGEAQRDPHHPPRAGPPEQRSRITAMPPSAAARRRA